MATVFVVLGIILLAVGLCFFESWVVMLVLNWLIASFGCAFALTFWQVFAIMFIINVIGSAFKSVHNCRK